MPESCKKKGRQGQTPLDPFILGIDRYSEGARDRKNNVMISLPDDATGEDGFIARDDGHGLYSRQDNYP
jgi:hypothetical protein